MSVMRSKKKALRKQRALVLGGGGALGAYQAGVLRILCKRLIEEDKKKENRNSEYEHDGKPLLFDIIAGTSIGAMNGAVLLSQYLKTGSWKTAAEQLVQFWTDKKKGLASTVSKKDLKDKEVGWEEWYNHKGTSGIASAEAARRYYSVKYYVTKGAPKVHEALHKDDSRFFDPYNSWLIHKPDRLEKTILNFARRKITTSHKKNQPRLLVFSVDAAEGKTVTFDSYPKANRSSKAGVKIDHVMASGTMPEFYDYKEIDGRKFWDGGWLSNTPFRELLQAHQEYWMSVMSKTKKDKNSHIPDLEVYIVNLHPAKRKVLPTDHDGVKDRQADIIYGDRSSHYDEKIAHLIADLRDFAARMKNLSAEAIAEVMDESRKKELREIFDDILARGTTKTATASRKGLNDYDNAYSISTYDDLLKGHYRLKVARIERGARASYDYYADSISGETGDFTAKSINRLIQEGKKDATDASLL
jgi:NTE family protein